MSKDLYFISYIAEALRQPNQETALQEAFARIKELGGRDEYRQGYWQFERFMAKAVERDGEITRDIKAIIDGLVYELSVELVSGAFDANEEEKQSVMDLLLSHPEWKAIYETLLEQFEEECLGDGALPKIFIEKDGSPFVEIVIEDVAMPKSVENITPGRYIMKLVSGRVVWEEELSAEDVLWGADYPERALPLAAATEEEASREWRLLEGEIMARLYPGMESGRLEIEVRE